MEDSMTATDIFRFDLQAAKVTYLRNKRVRGEPLLPVIDADAQARAMWEPTTFDPFDPSLPMFLRRQGE